MATNVPTPYGLQPTDTILSCNYSGQLSTFLIKSGYPQNIFQGDPVVLAGVSDLAGAYAGYIISLYDIPEGQRATTPILGIFQGCAYQQPNNFNGIDPSFNGRTYWSAGTTTLNSVPSVAQVAIDPNIVYQVLCNSNVPFEQNLVGQCGAVVFNSLNNYVQGNFQSGQSNVGISLPVSGVNSNTYVLGVAPVFPNITTPGSIQSASPFAYPVLNVILQNSQFAVRNAPRS